MPRSPRAKTGKLLTFTSVHNLPPDFNVAKLSLGIVELENGVRITGQLKVPKPKLGMAVAGKVEIVREAEYTKTSTSRLSSDGVGSGPLDA